jgi:thiamine pyrophosphate-dependent acetolactate synthase large subunit-like protein
MKTYEQFARLLAAAGVRTVFGVMGDGNMHWVAEYAELPGCRWCPAWHEAGAVGMADGWAAATGEVGVATVTMGPGLAQALAAITAAVRTRRPLVVITASVPATSPPQAQSAAQREWVQACGARYAEVRDTSSLPGEIARALAAARSGEVTVLVLEVMVFDSDSDFDAAVVPMPGSIQVPSDAELDLAASLLAGAVTPLVILGRGVVQSGCVGAALALGRRVGAAFATTLGGRTSLGDESFQLGVVGMIADPVTRDVVQSADVILVMGAALDRYNTDSGALGRDGRIVRIDRRGPAEVWSPSARTTHLTGELPGVLEGLDARLPATAARGARTTQLGAAIATEANRQRRLAEIDTADGPNPWAVIEQLDVAIADDAHIVMGIGHFWYFAAPYLHPHSARTFHYTCGFASIGQALAAGVGAATALDGAATALDDAAPSRMVVVVEGDGSIAMNIQELQAAVRLGVNLFVVVLNNRAYGSEYHKLALAGLDVASSEFEATPFDIAAVATAMGATARRAESIIELRQALAELLPLPGVRLVDAAISRSTLSETYARQHGIVSGVR